MARPRKLTRLERTLNHATRGALLLSLACGVLWAAMLVHMVTATS